MLDFINNVFFVEILWTCIAVTGFIFAAFNYIAARKTVRNLKSSKSRADKVELRVSTSLKTTELMRFVVQSIHVGIGVIALNLPASHVSHVPLKFQLLGYAFRWGLVASASLTAAQSVNLFRLRQFFAREKNNG